MVRFYLKALIGPVVRVLVFLGLVYLILPAWFPHHPPWGLLGIVFCFAWLVQATKHLFSTRWISGPERWCVRQRSEILVEMPAAKALERCTEAVRRMQHFRKVRPHGGDAIEARIGGWWTGERVSCRAIALDERHTRVLVSSRPTWPATDEIDFGRNWANVVAIREALVSGLPPGRRPSPEGPGPRARSPRRSFRPRASPRPAAR